MATLVLTAVGTLIGGPIGGAVGALVGRQVDGAVFGVGRREGPRLKDLSITTSSYGQPIARQHGRMRVAGSIIWATELDESRETSGGKGKPKTTTYSYSTSFAVALSSRPINGVGRIWADGNLLRGAAGDLKAGGTMRIHTGHGDQPVDPLIAAAEGAACPAFRNSAYVVFEDLQLGDFGNRIPALSFEVLADSGPLDLAQLIEPVGATVSANRPLPGLAGFELGSGELRGSLAAIDRLYPIVGDSAGEALALAAAQPPDAPPVVLGEAAAGWEDGDYGRASGRETRREPDGGRTPMALRYYDTARDYQPGIQRAEGRDEAARGATIEFPGALAASDARALVGQAAQRADWRAETLRWRVAEIDPALAAGVPVRLPDRAGTWRIASWEWRERGVELELERIAPAPPGAAPGDPGVPLPPADDLPPPTWLRAFELPWDGSGPRDAPALFAAASAPAASWHGAALYAERGSALDPIGATGRQRSVAGHLAADLPGSPGLLLEDCASVEIELLAADMQFDPATPEELAYGANRLLVGSEILQFAQATQVAESRWRIARLLRGRGGTEAAALAGHADGTAATLLDGSLIQLDAGDVLVQPQPAIAAIGLVEPEPVVVPVENVGATQRPLTPVHPRAQFGTDGSLSLCWTRRARGAWFWNDGVDTPLAEQDERYRLGIGPVAAPLRQWDITEPRMTLVASDFADLPAGSPVWVRQIGSHALSPPVLILQLP